jgi:hypothetical protein
VGNLVVVRVENLVFLALAGIQVLLAQVENQENLALAEIQVYLALVENQVFLDPVKIQSFLAHMGFQAFHIRTRLAPLDIPASHIRVKIHSFPVQTYLARHIRPATSDTIVLHQILLSLCLPSIYSLLPGDSP